LELFEHHTIIPHPIENVFALTVDLEAAPRWHSIFSDVQRLDSKPIGKGSRWRISFGIASFVLEIVDYQRPRRVDFKGSPIIGVVPNFTIELESVAEGTALHYFLHPEVPRALQPFVAAAAPPYGRRDLKRYFRQLDTMLAANP
jgi:uncharacterized protein YndB with AHSA1/START domain